MRGHNICFHLEIRKINFELSCVPLLIWSSEYGFLMTISITEPTTFNMAATLPQLFQQMCLGHMTTLIWKMVMCYLALLTKGIVQLVSTEYSRIRHSHHQNSLLGTRARLFKTNNIVS